jgi:hypothetical protein
MKDAVTAIDNFLSKIRYANHQATFDLQRNLIKGLAGIKYSLECYRNVILATSYMINHCKKGDGQFSDLWDQTVLHFRLNVRSCQDSTGISYITKAKMEETVKTASNTTDKFNPDCILNSKDVRYLVCSKKYKGFSPKVIATEHKLTEQQAVIMMSDCPPEPITPHKVNSICRLHKDGVGIDNIVAVVSMPFIKVAQVVIYNCTHTKGLF